MTQFRWKASDAAVVGNVNLLKIEEEESGFINFSRCLEQEKVGGVGWK